jgi:hypothetical protein
VGIQRRIEGHKDLVFAHDDDDDDVVVGTEAEDPSSPAILDTTEVDTRERKRFIKIIWK